MGQPEDNPCGMGQPEGLMNNGSGSGQNAVVGEQGKPQEWMKKTEQLHMGEIDDQYRDDGCHVDNQA